MVVPSPSVNRFRESQYLYFLDEWSISMMNTVGDNKKIRRRVKQVFETDYVRFLLRSLGRQDLMGELLRVGEFPEPYALFNDLCSHPHYGALLPMKFEAWSRRCRVDEPTPLELMEEIVQAQPESTLSRFIRPDWQSSFTGKLAAGMIILYRDEAVIVHTWPHFSRGRPIWSSILTNGCKIAIHRARPFLMDFANKYRIRMVDEESVKGIELYDRIESNWDFDYDGDGTWSPAELRC